MDVAEPQLEEEVDRIVGGQKQQEIDAEEEHQRQGDAERIFVERMVHARIGLVWVWR